MALVPFSPRVVLLSSALIATGIGSAGYFIGAGTERFNRQGLKTVKVKGIAERHVKSDFVVWNLTFRSSEKTLAVAQKSFLKNRNLVMSFLKEKGFDPSEITETPPVVKIRPAAEVNGSKEAPFYEIKGVIKVKTDKVDAATKASGDAHTLMSSHMFLGEGDYSYGESIQYLLKSFDQLRPELLHEATQSAKKMAQQFAVDSGSKVGKLIHADQGAFSILGEDGKDWGTEATILKKVRVVTQMTYALED